MAEYNGLLSEDPHVRQEALLDYVYKRLTECAAERNVIFSLTEPYAMTEGYLVELVRKKEKEQGVSVLKEARLFTEEELADNPACHKVIALRENESDLFPLTKKLAYIVKDESGADIGVGLYKKETENGFKVFISYCYGNTEEENECYFNEAFHVAPEDTKHLEVSHYVSKKIGMSFSNFLLLNYRGADSDCDTYDMHLNRQAYEQMYRGKKHVELRLWDEKRRRLKIGDEIKFSCTENKFTVLKVRVREISVFPSFQELFECIPLTQCGLRETAADNKAAVECMNSIYSLETQASYKVVAIKFDVVEKPFRDPFRMEPFLEQFSQVLLAYWREHPDTRFGQLLTTFKYWCANEKNCEDLFYIEDDNFIKYLREFLKN